jgi:glucokinase
MQTSSNVPVESRHGSQRVGAVHAAPATGRPFLAADIGGTHARLALVRARDGGIDILDQHKYLCADFSGLAPIVTDFLGTRGMVEDAAIGCAGLRRGDTIVSLNLPWPVSLPEIRALGIARAAAVNDFVAVAHATQCMGPNDGVLLTPDAKPDDAHPTDARSTGARSTGARSTEPGPVLVVGPGTGFGAALRVPVGERWLVLPSEAGQVSLAPGNARERDVLAQLQGGAGYVSAEQVVSGPGLLRLYRTLCVLERGEPACDSPAAVAAAAAVGGDARAVEAVAIFCAKFGSLLADTVMVTGAVRVFVAGGIVQKILPQLQRSDFVARFLDKGAMRQVLERVPVRLIDHPHKGVIGAASWYVTQASR